MTCLKAAKNREAQNSAVLVLFGSFRWKMWPIDLVVTLFYQSAIEQFDRKNCDMAFQYSSRRVINIFDKMRE